MRPVADMRKLAESWAEDDYRAQVHRDDAINEQHMALDVLDLLAEVERLRSVLSRVERWTHEHGAALKPRRADTYGEGMRDAKEQVARICRIAEEVDHGG